MSPVLKGKKIKNDKKVSPVVQSTEYTLLFGKAYTPKWHTAIITIRKLSGKGFAL